MRGVAVAGAVKGLDVAAIVRGQHHERVVPHAPALQRRCHVGQVVVQHVDHGVIHTAVGLVDKAKLVLVVLGRLQRVVRHLQGMGDAVSGGQAAVREYGQWRAAACPLCVLLKKNPNKPSLCLAWPYLGSVHHEQGLLRVVVLENVSHAVAKDELFVLGPVEGVGRPL